MCGIFGFKLNRPVLLAEVFRLLERLETHQYAGEAKPVGGYGAGLVMLNADGSILMEKLGKTSDVSPAGKLAKLVDASKARVMMAHVRMPSPQFMETARFRETAQPYVAACHGDLTVVSVHNGYIENYRALREKLGKKHVLESETIGLVDSEVIPHCFEEILKVNGDVEEAVLTLQNSLEGQMTMGLLQTGVKGAFLHLIHKGKTRGLTVWTNMDDEVIFCSRKEPLKEVFGKMLAEHGFEERYSIPWQTEESLRLSLELQ